MELGYEDFPEDGTRVRASLLPFDGDRYVVKGGAFSTTGGLARAAARHGRPANLRHVIIGFRCVTPPIGKKSKRDGGSK